MTPCVKCKQLCGDSVSLVFKERRWRKDSNQGEEHDIVNAFLYVCGRCREDVLGVLHKTVRDGLGQFGINIVESNHA